MRDEALHRSSAARGQTGFRHPAALHPGGVPAIAAAAKWRSAMSVALRGELRHDEPMSRHVSWRAGGRVERAYFPADLEDLQAFLGTAGREEPLYFVGLGSNLLVRDGGLRGTVVFTHWAVRKLSLVKIDESEGLISAE